MARAARWLLAAVLAAGPAWSAVPSPHAIDTPRWFTESFLDIREDAAEARTGGRRLMLYFGQDGCPYCKVLMTSLSEPSLAKEASTRLTAIALNIWGDREVKWIDGRALTEKSLAAALRVQYTPTLLFFDREGKVALRLNGNVPRERFLAAMAYVTEGHDRRQSFADYVQGRAPDPPRASLDRQSFFQPSARLDALARQGKPLLVVFERRACRECAELHATAFRDAAVQGLLARFAVVQVDAESDTRLTTPGGSVASSREFARVLQLPYVPSLVFFDATGAEVFRQEGLLRPFHVASALAYVAEGAYRTEPSFQRFVQARADRLRAAGQRVEIY